MKKSLVLALMLVIALSGSVMASDYTTNDEIGFKVTVAAFAGIEISDPEDINLENGEVAGESIASGTVTSNIPIKVSLQSSRFQYNKAGLNDWFRFDYKVGATKYENVELGSRRNTQHIAQGVTNLEVKLRSFLPAQSKWYDLTGDETHTITVTATVEAQ